VRSTVNNAHEECVWTCTWVPGSDGLVTGSGDETVKYWSSTSEGLREITTCENTAGYTLGVISVAVDPTGEWAASSALDSCVRVWELKDKTQERALLESMPTEIWSIAFSPRKDKCIIAGAGGAMGKIKLWDITDLTPGGNTTSAEPTLLEVVR
jgi:WD repeat-containing protein 61